MASSQCPLARLGIGLVGALIGGAIFRLFGIWPDSTQIPLAPSKSCKHTIYGTEGRWRGLGAADTGFAAL
jgi:hypothetical protein